MNEGNHLLMQLRQKVGNGANRAEKNPESEGRQTHPQVQPAGQGKGTQVKELQLPH